MTDFLKLKSQIDDGHYEDELRAVYLSKGEIARQRTRLKKVLSNFEELFGCEKSIELFSAPGRTEICGNHTDHNHGRVLAAAINLDAIAAAAKNNENICRVKSEGYSMDVVELDSLKVMPHEHHKSVALLRGVCAGFQSRGYKVGGFDATTASDVLSGSGLSSSAAFEVLLGTILNHLYNDGKVSAVEIAQIAQYAENEYFGKPCGLMDQTASSVGGFVAIDFKDSKTPVIEKVDFDFSACGHALCIVDTKGSHSGLTGEYAAVKEEMESVAAIFGKASLRSVPKDAFESKLSELRQSVGDRAILRAFHFYSENERVLFASEALSNGDFDCFEDLVVESGRSSYMYNQNIYLGKTPQSQPVSVALCMSERLLKGKGAWRVHGGGFAGTIQAFVPQDMLQEYTTSMDAVYGADSCYILSIRPAGGVKIL